MDLQSNHSDNIYSQNIHHDSKINTSQQKINKDSVNTRIDEEIHNDKNQHMNIKSISQPQIGNKKYKPIGKNKQKQNEQLMKHHKILQTLRNITKNIKSQINSHNQKHYQKQNVNNERKKMVDQSPQIKYLNQKVIQEQKKSAEPKKSSSKKVQIENELIPHKNQHKTPQKIQFPEKIKLYSKYKQSIQQFPVYEDKILTDKKQLRQLTIQREMDNDIESEDEQIQMGVGYLYYELVSSCKKNVIGMKDVSVIKSKNKMKKNDDIKMENVRQKLVFN